MGVDSEMFLFEKEGQSDCAATETNYIIANMYETS